MTSVITTPVADIPADAGTTSLGISKVVWWAVFVADSVVMSHWLSHFKAFTLQPALSTGIPLLVFSVAFLAGTLVLVYDGYAKEWGKGTIRNTIPWFESMVRWQLLRATSVSSLSVSSSSVETTV